MKKWFMLAMVAMVISIGIVTAQDSTAGNIVNDILPTVESLSLIHISEPTRPY